MRVVGRGRVNDKEIVTLAQCSDLVRQRLAGLQYPPPNWCSAVAVLVLPKPEFQLKLEPTVVTLKPGASVKLKVSVERRGEHGPIDMEVKDLPLKVTAAKATIPAGQASAEVELIAAADAELGEKTDVTIQGTAAAARATDKITIKIVKP